jgi:hypothetical protein
MASGHVNRANRPNTWLLRPMLQMKIPLANPEPSTHGPSRHLAAAQQARRFRGKADIAGRLHRLARSKMTQRRPSEDRLLSPLECIYRRAAHPLLGESERTCKSGCGEIDICPINGRS